MDTALLLALCALAQGLRLSTGRSVPPGPLYLWRHPTGLNRVRRAWVIPPISVSENHKKIPYTLVQIKSDKQQQGGVIYSIKGPGVDEEPLGIFSIDKFTGKVFLNAMLDREKTDHFRLKAFALDLGGSTLEDPTDLEIVVVDQNDNRPVFQQEVFTGHILEGAIPGTYVTKAEATDADDPDTDNAALRYSILDQGETEHFSIDELTGEIRTVQVGLDREVVGVYNLTLQVADMSGEGLTNTAIAVIYVDDINDNAPEFTSEEFSMKANEAFGGIDVGRLEVQDKDLPGSPNWVAKFTILEGDPDGQFAIRTDPKTNDGILSVVKPLDHESREHYQLRVSVQNDAPLQGSAPKAARGLATVTVEVQDVNEPPIFYTNPLRASVAEGAAPGTEVTTFFARDPDTQQHQQLSYFKDYDPEDWLRVDRATGRIQTKRAINPASPFLKDGWYRAIILASDDASPARTATGTLSIEILEVNDHAPLLASPTGTICSDPGQGSGLIIGAMDEDLPPHGAPFHFQLSPGSPELTRNWSISQLNVTHAWLRLRTEAPEGLYSLALLLQDSGQPPQQLEQLLNVTVCRCGEAGVCAPGTAALLAGGAGISLVALVIVLASVILLLLLVLLVAIFERFRQRVREKGLLDGLQDDVRDNILNYDEQGGGEEDQDAYDINQLRHPVSTVELVPQTSFRGRQPLRKDTPYHRVPPQPSRALPTSPSDIADFISDVSVPREKMEPLFWAPWDSHLPWSLPTLLTPVLSFTQRQGNEKGKTPFFGGSLAWACPSPWPEFPNTPLFPKARNCPFPTPPLRCLHKTMCVSGGHIGLL
ncbi:cadherin-15 isoform X2 [Monodelphis domestica]|uniref:cadherin-15 isoform X1 n=1 Tax=Monodelphis domestica TaxID=13616 RepID=UPI0024E1E62B|nr:cadherin-15 isoform X1 [Monodelphis domestica]XP_056666916.1 cadherin-15 isoform X2 [Monodelphis domestica]